MSPPTCAACGAPTNGIDRFCGSCGAALPAAAALATGDARSGPDRRVLWGVLVALGAVAAVLGVLGLLRLLDDDAVEVVLERHDDDGPAPFVDSVSVVDVGALVQLRPAPIESGGSDVVVSPVAAAQPGLYGTDATSPICDLAALAARLDADRDATAAWAGVMGVEPEQVGGALDRLTPVVLRGDTAVTNHSFRDGAARPYQAVLQAGTAVLVDDTGRPRVRCSCGNPLLAPALDADEIELVGEPWPELDPGSIARIDESASPLPELETVDLRTGDPSRTPLGGTTTLDGLLVSDSTGVHVYSERGEKLQTVLDRPVAAVVDDGAGGIVFNERWPDADDGYTALFSVPPSSQAATLWHLPAGATDPVPLVESDDHTRRWALLQAGGSLGDARVVAYAAMTRDPSAPVDAEFIGDLVVLDLDSGQQRVVSSPAYGWELLTGGVSFAGGRLAYDDGYAGPHWHLVDDSLTDTALACRDESDDELYDECWSAGAVLVDERAIVGVETDTGDSGELVTTDLVTGEVTRRGVTFDELEGQRRWHVDAHDGRVLVSRHDERGATLEDPLLVDLSDGSQERLAVDGTVRFLRAPLVRPHEAPAPTPEPESSTTAAPAPPIDPRNMALPAGVCGEAQEGPLPIVDGVGERGATADGAPGPGYVRASVEATSPVDADGDGTDETAVVVLCNYGGSGHWTPVVVLRAGADGDPELVGDVMDDFGRGGRDAVELAADGSTLIISGRLYLEDDALCCPSSTFSSRWDLQGGTWVETG